MKRIALTLPVLLAACATTYSPEQCASVDWLEKGYKAGVQARPLASIPTAREECAALGFTADTAAIAAGWERGRADFCTPLGVFEHGLREDVPLHLCEDPSLRADLRELEELSVIAEVHRATEQRYTVAERNLDNAHDRIERAEKKIRKRRREIADLKAQLDDPATPDAAKPEIRHAIEKFRDKIAKQRRRIRDARDDVARAESDLRVITPVFDDSAAYVEATLRSLR